MLLRLLSNYIQFNTFFVVVFVLFYLSMKSVNTFFEHRFVNIYMMIFEFVISVGEREISNVLANHAEILELCEKKEVV